MIVIGIVAFVIVIGYVWPKSDRTIPPPDSKEKVINSAFLVQVLKDQK